MADQGYTLTKGSIQRIGRATRIVENSNLPDLADFRESVLSRHDPVQWVPFRNDHDTTMPAFGVARVTGAITSEQQLYLTTTKPDSTLGQLYVVNGSVDVPAGGYGHCRVQDIGRVLYDASTGTPAFNETWGPKSGQWSVAKFYPGFTLFGNPDALVTAQGIWRGIDTFLGIASGSITAVSGTTPNFTLGTGTITIYVRVSSGNTIASTGITTTVYNSAGAVADGALVQCKRINGDIFVDVENCS